MWFVLANICVHSMFLCIFTQQHATSTYNFWLESNVALFKYLMALYMFRVSSGESLDGCEVPKDEAGIIWDSICFTFLLLQRRVFMSYYFLHVVADIRAGQILASRYHVFI